MRSAKDLWVAEWTEILGKHLEHDHKKLNSIKLGEYYKTKWDQTVYIGENTISDKVHS